MRRALWALGAAITFITGIGILSAPECESVSFSRAGGQRVSTVSCFADQSGAVPAWLAGVGLLAVAVIFILLSSRKSMAAQPSRGRRNGSADQRVRQSRSSVVQDDDARPEVKPAARDVGKQILDQARRANVGYRQIHAATQVDALLRNSRSTPSPRAWFFARVPEHLVVMFASDFVRRFQGAQWWSDIKSASGDGFWGSDGMVQQIRFGGVVYQGVEPQANAMQFVDQMRLHRLLQAPVPVDPDEMSTSPIRVDASIEERLLRLTELHSKGLISRDQLKDRTDEILREL